jgi:hypothetical protein
VAQELALPRAGSEPSKLEMDLKDLFLLLEWEREERKKDNNSLKCNTKVKILSLLNNQTSSNKKTNKSSTLKRAREDL